MTKKEFTSKLIAWLLVAVVAPFAIIAWKYDLFGGGKSKFTGWALIALVILGILAFVLIGYVLKLIKWSMWKQVLGGIRNIILPLVLLYFGCNLIAENIVTLRTTILMITICEMIAIPINPFPKWIYERNKQELIDTIKEAQ